MIIAPKRDEDSALDAVAAQGSGLRLEALLAAKAMTQPEATAFAEIGGAPQGNSEALNFAAADLSASCLATFLDELGLASGAHVGIALPNGINASVAVLACQRAGLTPCLLPLAWPREALTEAIASAGIEAVLTQTHVGDLAPAETFCRVAATFFGLRFICAFGEEPPDGVIALDPILAETIIAPDRPPGCADLVTFSDKSGRHVPVIRDSDALVAAVLPLVVSARIGETTPILSLLAPDDLAGLVVGPALALVTGAPLLMQGLFDSAALLDALAQSGHVHLVAPGWMEPALREAGLVDSRTLASLILVHRPPVLLTGNEGAAIPVIDVLALDETAVLSAARERDGRSTLGIDRPGSAHFGRTPLMTCRVSLANRIEVRGRGIDGRSLGAFAGEKAEPNADGWLATPFLAERRDGRIIAVRPLDPAETPA